MRYFQELVLVFRCSIERKESISVLCLLNFSSLVSLFSLGVDADRSRSPRLSRTIQVLMTFISLLVIQP